MGLLGNIIASGVKTMARNSTIKAVGNAAANIVASKDNSYIQGEKKELKEVITCIKPTRSSYDYCGEQTIEIVKELLGAGFKNITLKAINVLKGRQKDRYGEIESISINGEDDFSKKNEFPITSYIVIKYLDFKNNVDQNIYQYVSRIMPGDIKQEEMVTICNKKFCIYCGTPIKESNAKFCSNCGKAIE